MTASPCCTRRANGSRSASTLARTMRNIRQNLVFAGGYNALGIPVAAGALYPACGLLLSPIFPGAAMALSSVSVVMNALQCGAPVFDPRRLRATSRDCHGGLNLAGHQSILHAMRRAPAERFLRLAQQVLGLILASAFLVLAAPASAVSPESPHGAPVGSCAGMAAGACMEACRSGSASAINSAQSPQSAAEHVAARPLISHIGRSRPVRLPVACAARYGPPAYLKFQSLLL